MARVLKISAVLMLAIAFSGTGTAQADVLDDREAEPVVLTADQTPKLLGVDPGGVIAFAWFEGWGQVEDGWVPVTLQVDQRKFLAGGQLGYADPQSGAGADDDPVLDANDEIAMMAYDGGLPAGDRQAPEGVDPATRTSVRVSDPLEAGQQAWIYLFRSTGDLSPDGGDDLVSYFRDSVPLLVSSFPENSSVVTTRYDIGIRGRWMLNRLSVAAGEGSDQDILDGDKLNAGFPGCVASERTLSRGDGGLIADIDGPVRVIRSVAGEVEGASLKRDYFFYEGILDTHTSLNGLPAGSRVISALDLSRQAIGMTYRNSGNQEGVRIDGRPDELAEGPASWEQVVGSPGAVTTVTRVSNEDAGNSNFHEDQLEPPASSPMTCSGDAAAIGASGQEMTVPDSGDLEFTKRHWFDAPDTGSDWGSLHARQMDEPLDVTIDAAEPAILVARVRPSRVVLRPGQSRTLRVVVRNHGRKKAQRVRICARTAKWARARCRKAARVSRGGKVVRRITVRASRKARRGVRVLPVRATANKARSYSDRIRVRVRAPRN